MPVLACGCKSRRRRGAALLRQVEKLEGWQRIHVPHAKRKYPNLQVHESTVGLPNYDGGVRQLIISNDHTAEAASLVSDYARRWRIENGIAEAVKFFSLNALSSPILVKVHFDVVLTALADTLYTMLARKLHGFEECHAPKLFRHFVEGKATVRVAGSRVVVTYPRRAHHPIRRQVPWSGLPTQLPAYPGAKLELRFA